MLSASLYWMGAIIVYRSLMCDVDILTDGVVATDASGRLFTYSGFSGVSGSNPKAGIMMLS